MGERLEKLKQKKQKLKEQYQRGKIVTEQIRAERLRKKKHKMGNYEPGMIRYGLAVKQNPIDLMKDAYERRQHKRKEKQKDKRH